ncbi:uncharacterized protein TNCV_2181281 [Trichonephila clavipes]|uniref:CCHC-type domain-containing protein n=1 Tax=Trichonephila clavipes TaxID=2585209 RepID=A0A8X6VUP9_TRICX|nr:uncharacterized protein TNCV_2181281 [Trichonephila clavipes]
MADVKDPKSALLYALKVEAATQASCIDSHSIREARVTADEPCESRCKKEIEKLKEEMRALIPQRYNRRGCWGCGHLRSNCPRNNKEDSRTKCWGCGGAGHIRKICTVQMLSSQRKCSHQKGSLDGNIEAPSRGHFIENNKYSWGVEKKFGVIDPVVRQVSTPSIS